MKHSACVGRAGGSAVGRNNNDVIDEMPYPLLLPLSGEGRKLMWPRHLTFAVGNVCVLVTVWSEPG